MTQFQNLRNKVSEEMQHPKLEKKEEKEDSTMKAAGKIYDPVTYAGAGHGFMRDGENPSGTEGNRKARAEAWDRWKKLLGK